MFVYILKCEIIEEISLDNKYLNFPDKDRELSPEIIAIAEKILE